MAEPIDVKEVAAVASKVFEAVQKQIAEAMAGVDWGAIKRQWERFFAEAHRLGEEGWTLPMWATPGEVMAILEASTRAPLDDVFIEFYEMDNGENYRNLKSSLLRDDALKRWQPLVAECFTAYEQSLYLPVVPAMITVIEGAIAESGGSQAWVAKDPKQTAGRILSDTNADSMRRAIWASVSTFASHLFESRPFAGDPPERLNRAWILHGRDYPTWNKADCLRLLQAADTIKSWQDLDDARLLRPSRQVMHRNGA